MLSVSKMMSKNSKVSAFSKAGETCLRMTGSELPIDQGGNSVVFDQRAW